MKFNKIHVNEEEYYYAFQTGEVEKVNPIEFFKEYHLKSRAIMQKDLIISRARTILFPIPINLIEKLAFLKAYKWWAELSSKINKIPIPSQIISLLNSKKKKQQVKLLKGFNFTSFELLAYIFYAFKKEGYLFSQYEGEHFPEGFEETDKPDFMHLGDDGVIKSGETQLTDGQMKEIITKRRRTIAKFLDKEDEWHCFFVTYSSLRGDECWKEGQPHFHYISDKFGLDREYVVEQIKSKKYNLGSLPHIDFDYGHEEE